MGCTLVAESLPDGTRPQALGMLQAISAFGNVAAGFLSLMMIALWSHGVIASQWRWLFSLGILPSLLSIIVARKLREPEVWKKAVAAGKAAKKAGSLVELFGDPRWRPRAIVGMLLAASGVVGLWGIGVFSNDLTQSFIGREYDDHQRSLGEAQKDLQFVAQVIAAPERIGVVQGKILPRDLLGTDAKDVDAALVYGAAVTLRADGKEVSPTAVLALLDQPNGDRKAQTVEERRRRDELLQSAKSGSSLGDQVSRILTRQKNRGIKSLYWAAITLIMFNLGAVLGMYTFARITHRIGRRPTFVIFFLAAGLTTAFAFLYMSKPADLFWMAPLIGAGRAFAVRRLRHLFPRVVSHAVAEHGHVVLLQRRPLCGRDRPDRPRTAHQVRLRRHQRAHSLCRRSHVFVLPGGARGFTVRTETLGQPLPE